MQAVRTFWTDLPESLAPKTDPPAATTPARRPARANSGAPLFATTALSTGALCGLALAASLVLSPAPAAAQFVCVGNATGALVPPGTADGAGATATGASASACGPNANATGANATATGQNSNATGFFATATGQNAGRSGEGVRDKGIDC